MTEVEARAVVASAMHDANVHGVRRGDFVQRFRAGTADARLDELELDSLATMEICIAIEAHTGVELVPERLARFGTLEGLARFVARGRGR